MKDEDDKKFNVKLGSFGCLSFAIAIILLFNGGKIVDAIITATKCH